MGSLLTVVSPTPPTPIPGTELECELVLRVRLPDSAPITPPPPAPSLSPRRPEIVHKGLLLYIYADWGGEGPYHCPQILSHV